MKNILLISGLVSILSVSAFSQTSPKVTKFPAGVPVKEAGIEATGGKVEERTYSNKKFSFQITVPENWYIGGSDFEKVLKDNGHDISVDLATSRASRNIDVLMTAFRSEAGSGGAVLRVTSEDLKLNPQIRDAVDYFDAITAAYATAKLPPDFVYSTTKAEKLGAKQFAFLDTSSKAGKKRMYATVKNGSAIMFTLSYQSDDDLQTLRRILESGDFKYGIAPRQ
ncbi:MAG: hypothetical protein QM785_17105 [Pyrinomonadaceae bacterium]